MNVSLTTSCNAAKTAVFLWNLSPNLQLIAFQGGQLPCGGGRKKEAGRRRRKYGFIQFKVSESKMRKLSFLILTLHNFTMILGSTH